MRFPTEPVETATDEGDPYVKSWALRKWLTESAVRASLSRPSTRRSTSGHHWGTTVLNGITAVTTRTMLSASAQRAERWFMATPGRPDLRCWSCNVSAAVVTSISNRPDSLLGGVQP